MNVKKFSARTSREALRMVRDALGADAVILSNRTVNGSVEVLALASADMASLAEPAVEKEVLPQPLVAALAGRRMPAAAPAPIPAPARSPEVEQARVQPQLRNGSTASAFERLKPTPVEVPAPVAVASAPVERQNAPQPRAASAPVDNSQAEMRQMMEEIRSMRSMMEAQLAEISWGAQHRREPMKATVMREMLAAGFSASLARYLTEKLPEHDGVDGMAWIKGVLMRNLSAAPDENAILDNGGVFALVGPTGVGKTTTTAKLAARCVMRHGAGKLALITTDGYRIGGFEQLRIYGKILGVMVHSVKDEADLRIALSELKNKHTVLIDTAGASQRDQMVAEQVAMLSGADTPVKRILCMSATSTGETLNEVVRAYKGNGLAGAIITKLDEAATIGSVLDVIIRQKLQLQYIANGQRVPEDLHLARPNFLIDRAFKMKRETAPFQYQDDELPLVIGNTARMMNDQSLREVAIG
ncbi:flagellar biosynthesis protein FlhF|uniref:flagellar biosynthesis protein FlhF n=1 Tax=Noviherbaspirillum sp. L7-7A TaxID=2850560 RepID=UPI001C2C80E8|nr:flagellar biosynthesis protein FlhF [Noviherbaspirillum sp. L7-7A]MBV0879369.1 flagellar biosynthesis protein FlhF [Noviherbaspirillum sp. L7-7A]